MVNKSMRLFKILFFPISLLFCLSIFMISSFAQSGYVVETNGNIKSLNLWNEKWRNGYYNTSNGLFVYDSNYVCTDGAIALNPNTTYTISIVNNMDFQFYDYTSDFLFNVTRYINDSSSYTFTTNSYTFYMTFYITDLYGSTYKNDIMLNQGNTLLDYFPYGYYFNNSVNQVYSIYNIFNGVEVWLQNLTSDGVILTETLSLNVEQTNITFSDLPNIRSYIYSHPTYEPFTLIFYFGPSNPQNASYIITLDGYDWQPTIKLSGFSDKVFNRSNNSNTFLVNTFNETYSSLSIIDFESSASVINSFRLSLVQADTSYYNNGYSNGYNDGLTEGENIGFQNGYQSGYNTGSTTNIETNGIRTLFNSILSFPVDMIKSVFNFEFMGVNISSVIMFIVSIGIVAFVLKKFL